VEVLVNYSQEEIQKTPMRERKEKGGRRTSYDGRKWEREKHKRLNSEKKETRRWNLLHQPRRMEYLDGSIPFPGKREKRRPRNVSQREGRGKKGRCANHNLEKKKKTTWPGQHRSGRGKERGQTREHLVSESVAT